MMYNKNYYRGLMAVCFLSLGSSAFAVNKQDSHSADTDSIIVVPTDTLNSLSGKTVSMPVRVYGNRSVQMDSTTITKSGDLRVSAEEAILVISGTEVELGGELQLNGALQYLVRFTYDASGNRIRRELDSSVK